MSACKHQRKRAETSYDANWRRAVKALRYEEWDIVGMNYERGCFPSAAVSFDCMCGMADGMLESSNDQLLRVRHAAGTDLIALRSDGSQVRAVEFPRTA